MKKSAAPGSGLGEVPNVPFCLDQLVGERLFKRRTIRNSGAWGECWERYFEIEKGLDFFIQPLDFLMARQGGLEPPTDCLEGNCSIRLSYWRAKWKHSVFFPGLKVKPVLGHFLLLPALELSMNSTRIAGPGALACRSARIPGWAFFNLFPLRQP